MHFLPLLFLATFLYASDATKFVDDKTKSDAAKITSIDLKKNVDISKNKTLIIDLGHVQTLENFFLNSNTAHGSATFFSAPEYEDPSKGKWSELGTLQLNPNKSLELNAPAQVRYLKVVFSDDSKGVIESLSAQEKERKHNHGNGNGVVHHHKPKPVSY